MKGRSASGVCMRILIKLKEIFIGPLKDQLCFMVCNFGLKRSNMVIK